MYLTTKGNLSLLVSKPHWLGDGTNDSANRLSAVHALVDEFQTVPRVGREKPFSQFFPGKTYKS